MSTKTGAIHLDWWDRGYGRASEAMQARFRTEARAGLPAIAAERFGLDDVFAGLMVQRMRLRQDQGIQEWSPAGAARTARVAE